MMSELAFLVRQRPRSSLEEPRLNINLVKQLGWILHIRRMVLERHDRSPVPGSVVLLAPHYREGMDLIYEDMRKALRFVVPDPMRADALGSSAGPEDNLQ